MRGRKELCNAIYKAVQDDNIVYVIAFGQNSHNRYEVELEEIKPIEEISAVAFSPHFRLTNSFLGGKVINVETKFAVYAEFLSEAAIETIIIHDAQGTQPVPVEQTPNYDISAEIKELRKKDIQYKKLSASLSDVVQEYEEVGVTASVVNSTRASITPIFVPSGGGAPEAVIFIRCDENASFENLPGIHVNSEKGTLRTAKVSLDVIEELSKKEDVEQLIASAKFSPLNDRAAELTQLNNFRNSNNQHLTGKGVIIGIVDTGIDSSHPSFEGRILSIWDQEIKGSGWEARNYGKVLTGALLAASEDSIGHGTHVAGIAAGSHDHFGGVAPDAHLIVVKTDFNNAHIGDGIEYIFAEADKLGMPAVVNLSLGNHTNAHDGTDCLSELVDISSREGRIIVAAAGNEGETDIHAGADISPGYIAEVKFRISSDQTPPIVIFSGWYEGTGKCEISVRTPSGSITPPQELISQGETTRYHQIENMFISISTPATPSPRNGDRQFRVKLQSSLIGQIQPGKWQIIIRNAGESEVKVDIWSAVPDVFSVAKFLPPFRKDDIKIGSPGCARSAITVGAYTTKNNWLTVTGSTQRRHVDEKGIANFSSQGPTRDGRLKPDIVAPGEYIASCLSGQVSQPEQSDLVNPLFIIRAGTSMSCPFVAGLCALLLQKNSSMTSDEIKKFLQENAKVPVESELTGEVIKHHPQWGFGPIKF